MPGVYNNAARTDIMNDRAGFSVVYLREALLEQERTWGDPFKYGISATKAGSTKAVSQYDVACYQVTQKP